MKIIKFEDLEIWKLSLKITKLIYDITSINQFSQDFDLKNQIRRSVISISSNIVEGFEKNSNNEFIRFLKISKGSVGEARNQLYIALSINYIDESEFNKLNELLMELANKIGGLSYYLESKRKLGEFKTR
ncbi:four helix bundle protein [Patescibacteria group bacterium]|nr:four helix bundle protein [Patescibacteria group bacterium]